MAQTAEGALGEIHGVLGRMRELAMQSANGGTLSATDRGHVNTEFSQLKAEITRIQGSSKYNGVSVVAAAAVSSQFQVGLGAAASDRITVAFGGVALTAILATASSVATVTESMFNPGLP